MTTLFSKSIISLYPTPLEGVVDEFFVSTFIAVVFVRSPSFVKRITVFDQIKGIAKPSSSWRIPVAVALADERSITCSLLEIHNKLLKSIALRSLITGQHPVSLALASL